MAFAPNIASITADTRLGNTTTTLLTGSRRDFPQPYHDNRVIAIIRTGDIKRGPERAGGLPVHGLHPAVQQ
jgi:hypothetical protein